MTCGILSMNGGEIFKGGIFDGTNPEYSGLHRNALMKAIVILIFVLTSTLSYPQDTCVTWLYHVDTLTYKTYYTKHAIPKDFLKFMEVTKKEVANPGERFASGCNKPHGMPFMRLNWLAKDNSNHVVISISAGGYAFRTLFFFLDYEKEKLNVNEIIFSEKMKLMTFGEAIIKVNKKEFEFR